MAPPSFKSQRKQNTDQADYNSFYKIKKTKLCARYPFLPTKQIERKIKHLWERASTEKRATLCLTSSCTTAKSPFKGSILQGLCKKRDPSDQIIPPSVHLSYKSPLGIGGSADKHTLRSSIKRPQSAGRVLRSSAKKNICARRVSFNFDQSSPAKPTNQSFPLGLDRNFENKEIITEESSVEEKNKTSKDVLQEESPQTTRRTSLEHLTNEENERIINKVNYKSPRRRSTRISSLEQKREEKKAEKIDKGESKATKDTPQGHRFKRRELSREEEKLYEFVDEGTRLDALVSEAGNNLTQLKPEASEHVFNPEEYNIESALNAKVFYGENQSPVATPGKISTKPANERGKGQSSTKPDGSKQKCATKEKVKDMKETMKRSKNPRVSEGKVQAVKGRRQANYPGRDKTVPSPSARDNIEASQSDDEAEVPWMVSACPDSSSEDGVQENSQNDSEDNLYDYYHKSSSESNPSSMQSLTEESVQNLGSTNGNHTTFSWNGVCFTKKSAGIPDAFDSQLSLASVDVAEVMSVSTDPSLSSISPPSEFGFTGRLMTSSPQWSLPLPEMEDEGSPAPKRRSMRLRNGEAEAQSPKQSQFYHLDKDKFFQIDHLSPESCKMRMRLKNGEATKESPKSFGCNQIKAEHHQVEDLASPKPKRRVMRLQNGESTGESPKASQCYQLNRDERHKIQELLQDPLATLDSPTSRKKRMRNRRGESPIATTGTTKERENLSSVIPGKRNVASLKHPQVIHQERNVLKDVNARATSPVPKTKHALRRKEGHAVLLNIKKATQARGNRVLSPKVKQTITGKEDRAPTAKTRRLGRMRRKDGMSGSQTDESSAAEDVSDSPGFRGHQEVKQNIRGKEDRAPVVKTRRSGRMRRKDGMMSGSQTEDSSAADDANDSPGFRGHQEVRQTITGKEDRAPMVKTRRSGRMRRKDGMMSGSQAEESSAAEDANDSPGFRGHQGVKQNIRGKEDRAPMVKTRRAGRMRMKDGMMNGSQTEDSSVADDANDSPGFRGHQEVPQICCSPDDASRSKSNFRRGRVMKSVDEEFKSEGLLCDLFQPNLSPQKRTFKPSTEPSGEDFYKSCMDPVSSHLFLDENFFL